MIGQIRFFADEDDGALPASVAQAGSQLTRCMAGADDDDGKQFGFYHGHTLAVLLMASVLYLERR